MLLGHQRTIKDSEQQIEHISLNEVNASTCRSGHQQMPDFLALTTEALFLNLMELY